MNDYVAFIPILVILFSPQAKPQERVINNDNLSVSVKSENVSVDAIPTLKLKKLQDRGLISKRIEEPVPADADFLSLKEKYILADVVVIGTVSKKNYLYKEGELFRTNYDIAVESYLKGNGNSNISVLDFSGPELRDHSVWAGRQKNVELDSNDRVLVFLKKTPMEQIKKEHPKIEKLASGRYVFQHSYTSIYILDGDSFDNKYLEATGMMCEFKTITDLKAGINEIVAEIEK